ncbi:MAG TPA: DUF6798 domain-containing protein [Lacipirellulaceae bacterium]|nr:DUF6798 domain-containing protein [Lacipirellulaceae bacterium]
MMFADPTNDLAPAAAPQKRWRQFGEVLLIVLVFFIVAGDPTPGVNETHYISRLKHFWNPSWCKGDLFLESTDTQIVFIWLFGWLTRWLSLSATSWVGRIAAWVLIAWAWQRLSWRLVPRPLAAVFSAALFLALNNYMQLAGEWVVGGVEAKCFAYAFVLLALKELVDRHWNLVIISLGAAMAFHPIVGGWSGLICAGIWFLDGRREQNFLSLAPGIVVGGLLAIVGLAPALSLTWHDPPDLVAEANCIYVFERLPHHLSILTLPGPEIVARLLRHAGLLAMLFALMLIVKRLGAQSRVSASRPCRSITLFAWGAVLLACAGLSIELILWNQPTLAAKLLKDYWFRLTDFAAPMAVALLTTVVIAVGVQRHRRWAPALLACSLLLCVWLLATTAWTRIQDPTPPADRKITDFADWVNVCHWVATNTPRDALFLTPRLNQSFKWRTGRPEVANWKDIPQDAPDMVRWYERIKDIYYTEYGGIEQALDSIGGLGTERVRELAHKYHASYVLMDRGELLSLPIAYWNEEYVVYRIEDRSARKGR